jgi:hypothetical protein
MLKNQQDTSNGSEQSGKEALGLIQVGVGEARSRKNKWSESVGVADRPGPANPADPTMELEWAYIMYTNVAT